MSLLFRYPGIRPFTKEEEGLFFGRETEINELFHSIEVHDVFVLFSKSGLGKSSLLNAGLIPNLIKEKYFPINIRFTDSYDHPLPKIILEVKKIIATEQLQLIPLELQDNLWALFNSWNIPETPILIFDQFEEFFYFESNKREETISAIADLIGTKVPKSVLDNIKDTVNSQLLKKPIVKVLFVIRSDRLSHLDEISVKIPVIFNNRYQLKPLRKEKAELAIALPAQLRKIKNHSFNSSAFEYSIESLQIIIKILTLNNQKNEIESTQLQIVCQELERTAQRKRKPNNEDFVIEPAHFDYEEGIKLILNRFYELQLKNLMNDDQLNLNKEDFKIIRTIIESELISGNKRIMQSSERVKELLSRVKPDVSMINGIKKEDLLIDKLLELRLIREEETHLGKVYEVSHDTLVESIVKARDLRKNEELAELNKQLGAEKELTVDKLNALKDKIHCFVVMGFGVKTDLATGRKINLDKSYLSLIKPVVEGKGITCLRADELKHDGTIDAPMYEQLLTADLVIADLSTANVNAFYELGIRHALRPRTTIIMSEEQMVYPFDISHIKINKYTHLGDSIDYFEVLRFQKLLGDTIDNFLKDDQPDSPVYTFLDYLNPPSLKLNAIKSISEIEGTINESTSTRKDWDNSDNLTLSIITKQAEDALKTNNYAVAKGLFNSALLISGSDKPGSKNSYLIHRLAFATFKSKLPNELEAANEALSLLYQLDLKRTNDVETINLAGSIERRLFELDRGTEDHLERAIEYYERNYYLSNDCYIITTLAFLLNLRVDTSLYPGKEQKIADLVLANRWRSKAISLAEEILKDIYSREKQYTEEINPKEDKYKDNINALRNEIFWILASKAEAYFGLGLMKDYEATLNDAVSLGQEAWKVEVLKNQIEQLRILLDKYDYLIKLS